MPFAGCRLSIRVPWTPCNSRVRALRVSLAARVANVRVFLRGDGQVVRWRRGNGVCARKLWEFVGLSCSRCRRGRRQRVCLGVAVFCVGGRCWRRAEGKHRIHLGGVNGVRRGHGRGLLRCWLVLATCCVLQPAARRVGARVADGGRWVASSSAVDGELRNQKRKHAPARVPAETSRAMLMFISGGRFDFVRSFVCTCDSPPWGAPYA